MTRHRILFVCLGNICRSPMAEGVFAHIVAEAGHGERFHIDSAGTGAWHVGNPPDPRAVSAAAERGIDLTSQRAREVRMQDFEKFDLILAMDSSNHEHLLRVAPEEHSHKIRLFLDHLPEHETRDVPDPYYGGDEGFNAVLDLIEDGARVLLGRLA